MTKEKVLIYPWTYAIAADRTPNAPVLPLQGARKLPAIQGLRGLAVLLVVLFHVLTRYVPFGWTGVWLFFAISGFVITLSLENISSNSNRAGVLSTFYGRRVRRIIPLYFFILAFGCLVSVTMAFAQRPELPPVLDHLPFLLSFTYNFYRMSGAYEHTELFGHLWSLCVEEQFYLVYPFAFLFLSRSARIWLLVSVILLCPIGRLCLSLYLDHAGYAPEHIANIVYLCPFSNFDAFSTGCLAACLRESTARLSSRFWFGVVAGLIGALLSYVAVRALLIEAPLADVLRAALAAEIRGTADQVAIYSFLALLAGALVVICANHSLSRFSIFTTAPLVWLGELSYGIYMFHFPLLYLRYQLLPAFIPGPYAKLYGSAVLMMYLASLLAISYLSFRYIESPFLHAAGQTRRWWRWRAVRSMSEPRV